MDKKIEKLFAFATFIAALKSEERFKTVKNVKGDTVASHCWRLAILTFLIAEELQLNIDVYRAVKLALIHDFPEIVTGDLDANLLFHNHDLKDQKHDNEVNSMKKMEQYLSAQNGNSFQELWEEYEFLKSREAKYVYSLDKIEGAYTYMEQNVEFENPDLEATYCNCGYELFPELKPVLDYLRNRLKAIYAEKGHAWKPEYDAGVC